LKNNLKNKEFWRNTLNLDNYPVEITKIVEKWDLKPEVFFSSEGEIYE
jgi:hypothetical protein